MRGYVVFLGISLGAACGEVPAVVPDAAACMTSADCTNPASPYCVSSQCVATCSVNTDCTDAAHAICASDGVCVGCTANAECTTSDSPICDSADRECRGCTKDSECSGGVCVEAEGTCVADASVAFVTMMGNDTGTCTRAAPCATVPYAVGQAGTTRRVIHVLGASLQSQTALNLTGNRVLDGENTTFNTSGTPLTITAPATVVVEGFRFSAPTSGSPLPPTINITGAGAKATLFNLTVTGPGNYYPAITGGNGTDITLRRSHIGTLTTNASIIVACQNGNLLAEENTFENAYIEPPGGTVCDTIVRGNRFESGYDSSVHQNGGHLTMENNLIIHNSGFNDSISLGNLAAGSVVRFNTIVNTTAVASDGAALGCDNSVNATSNIIAYNSGHPIVGQGCMPRYTIFDTVSLTSAGVGNQIVDLDSIFVDRASGDYHLKAGSAARAGAEPGLTMVKTDYEDKLRPAPAGTNADCGAFEAQD